MDSVSLSAFEDELEKIAGWDLWQRFLDVFRTKDDRAQRRVDYHFSPKASSDKWNKLIRNASDPAFVAAIAQHKKSDSKLVQHTKSMHDLAKGKPAGKIQSSTLPGKTYEVRKIPSGFGCQCNDWRYKGSVSPGYECKHIRAHKAGKLRA